MYEWRTDLWLPAVKDRLGAGMGGGKCVWLEKGNMRNPGGDGNVCILTVFVSVFWS